jgi:hypothetical protein
MLNKVLKIPFPAALPFLLACFISSCSTRDAGVSSHPSGGPQAEFSQEETAPGTEDGDNLSTEESLEKFTEIERTGAWFPGLGLAESGLREKQGDFRGAVIAAYKDLAYHYGYGNADKARIEEALRRVVSALEDPPAGKGSSAGAKAGKGILAFIDGQWEEGLRIFKGLSTKKDESDSFLNWMILACSLEINPADSASRSVYGAIRARYDRFPEYWYRGARAFDGEIAASYAERCIDLNPEGPYSRECREILAKNMGLTDSKNSIRTKGEVEKAVKLAVSSDDPAPLEEILPLMDLPDNEYTLYALGALKVISVVPGFREYFEEKKAASRGRLADRLAYIIRG